MKKIYCVSWTSVGFGLNAVVLADDENEAESMLELDTEKVEEVSIFLLGFAADHENESRVVAHESL